MNYYITITDYTPAHQTGISDLLDSIQSEFAESIYGQSGPKTLAPIKLWVALHNDIIVGTAGMSLLGNNNAALKSMMLQKEYRGAVMGLSNRLIDIALQYAESNGAEKIYLGTMTQFKAAQHFYLKHGFVRIEETLLPNDFIKNPVDDVFFMRTIK